ncbi:MAG: hypothetical protein J3K34DRAFT_470605 [Monoraphidium minutum]|nr:MAG: hypothetical protein J3K34DRAFT_470605 [Monoraphidium minutum]
MVEIKGLRGPAGEFGALGVIDVPGGAREVYEFVADVEQQPAWNGAVKASKILERRGGGRQSIHQSIHQVLQWNFLALRGDMHMYLEQEEDAKALEITTQLNRGTMMRRFRSR